MIIIEAEYDGIEGLKRSEINTVFREALWDTGEFWFENILPDHFGEQAKRKYDHTPRRGDRGSGFKKRSASYQAGKERKFGHRRHLEYSGESKQETLQRKNIESRFRGGAGWVKVKLPKGWNRRHASSKVKMREEITRVRPGELQRMSGFLVARVDARLEKAGAKYKGKPITLTRE